MQESKYIRPNINIDVFEIGGKEKMVWWNRFKKHHYLNAELNMIATCFLGVWDGEVVAFSGNLSLPGRIPPLYPGDTRNKFRESRLVVLPDYQGLGIGMSFSNCIGEIFLLRGFRYFSKTAHIKMGEYRQRSPLWRPTQTNLKSREKSQKRSRKELWYHMELDTKRLCYSHEYVGQNYSYSTVTATVAVTGHQLDQRTLF